MKKTKTIRFVESLILLPIMTMMTPLGSFPSSGVSAMPHFAVVVSEQTNEVDAVLKVEGDAIDRYFKAHDMPLFGTGLKMATEADANDLDWRLLPAIAVRESTGGKNDCNKVKNNPFGWGSCKIGFKTLDEAIETIARNLGGNNPKTAGHYDNKTVKQILHAYNPPSIVPRYAEQVMSIMDNIGALDFATTSNNISA